MLTYQPKSVPPYANRITYLGIFQWVYRHWECVIVVQAMDSCYYNWRWAKWFDESEVCCETASSMWDTNISVKTRPSTLPFEEDLAFELCPIAVRLSYISNNQDSIPNSIFIGEEQTLLCLSYNCLTHSYLSRSEHISPTGLFPILSSTQIIHWHTHHHHHTGHTIIVRRNTIGMIPVLDLGPLIDSSLIVC